MPSIRVSNIKLTVSALCASIAMIAFAPTASAADAGYSSTAVANYGGAQNYRLNVSDRRYSRGNRGHRNRGHHRRNGSGYRSGYGSGYSSGYNCRSVQKKGYWHGEYALIGGTMCYDSYGQSYIVPGSRYLIEYYY